MKLKKTLSLIIATTLSCSFMFTSVAAAENVAETKIMLMEAAGEVPAKDGATKESPDTKISKDEAIATAKKMIEGYNDYEIGYVNLNPSWGASANRVWNIEFYCQKAPGGNANVAVDSETGEILNFNIWEGYDNQTNFVAKMTRTEAKVNAEKFIKEQLKESIDSYELQKEDPYMYGYRMGGVKEPIVYNFTYVKKVNGVPFSNYTINVGIDGVNGKVRSYYSNRVKIDEKKFPSTKDVLSAEKVFEKYKELVKVKLQYIATYSHSPYGMSKPKVTLAYVPVTYVNMMDASTGKVLNYDGSSTDFSSEEIKQLLNNPVPMKPDAKISNKAISEKDAKAKAEEYKKIVEKLLGITFDNPEGNESKPYYYGSQQDEVWNFNWYKNSETGNVHFNIAISAKTGHLLNISLGSYDNMYDMKMRENKKPEPVKEKLKWANGKEKALELVKKLVPDQYGFYVDENIKEPEYSEESRKYLREHYYSFTRIENGIRFRDNSINVGYDRETGKLRNFYFNWSDMEFPAKTALISEEEATKKYFEGTEAKLMYFLKADYTPQGVVFGETPQLVYSFNTKGYMYGALMINANTGKEIDYSGNEIKYETPVGEANIADHWAKRSAELLVAQGILKNPNVDLNSKVTKAEAVKMITLSKGINFYYYEKSDALAPEPTFKDVPKDDEYFQYIESAIKQKLISKDADEFKGSEKMTKAEFVKLLVNLIGYSDIAKHKDIFKVNNVINVPYDMTGYVAIASVLDILPVQAGNTFNGSDEVTYGEAADSLYKALSLVK
ncbi:MAG: S-layer homology domain-containing protein [Clostridia bacterium]|nr:S-layer homology domain-containing protein [Clostridia bacterium]